MSDQTPRFTGHCVLDGCVIDVHDALGQIPVVGGDIDRAIFKHVASAMMQYLGRHPHARVVREPGKPIRAEGPLMSESEAATKFLEYRMLCYVESADPRLEAFRAKLLEEVAEALEAGPRPSPANGAGLISPT
jgi:hypothetical protein